MTGVRFLEGEEIFLITAMSRSVQGSVQPLTQWV